MIGVTLKGRNVAFSAGTSRLGHVKYGEDECSMLQSFKSGLEAIVGRPTTLRPFVCDGSPLDCRVFIVGFNPATDSEVDFWTFWSSDRGFNKALWYQNYLKERRERPP